jgi:hypothetical protein
MRSRFRLFLIIPCKRKSFGLGTKPRLDARCARSHARETFGPPVCTLEDAAGIDAIRPRPLIARPTPKPQLNPAIPPTQTLANLGPRRRASIELLNEKEPGRSSDQALSGKRRGAYCTRNVDS